MKRNIVNFKSVSQIILYIFILIKVTLSFMNLMSPREKKNRFFYLFSHFDVPISLCVFIGFCKNKVVFHI